MSSLFEFLTGSAVKLCPSTQQPEKACIKPLWMGKASDTAKAIVLVLLGGHQSFKFMACGCRRSCCWSPGVPLSRCFLAHLNCRAGSVLKRWLPNASHPCWPGSVPPAPCSFGVALNVHRAVKLHTGPGIPCCPPMSCRAHSVEVACRWGIMQQLCCLR